MKARLVVPPLLVALVAAGIWAASRQGAARPPVPAPVPDAANGHAAATVAEEERKWHPQPVHTEEVPITEKVPAVVRAPKAVELRSKVKLTRVKEIRKFAGQVVKKGEVVIVLHGETWEKELAAAKKAGDAKRIAAAEEALANLEIRAEEEGIIHRLDASVGELPIFNGDVCLPMVFLFDWRKLTWEGTAPGALAPSLALGAGVMVASGKDPPVAAYVEKRGDPAADGSFRLVVRPTAAPPGVPEAGGEATIHVVTGKREVLVVPAAAIRTERGRNFVHVVPASGKPVPREVVVGQPASRGWVEVSGVRMNESVAVWE